MAVYKINKFAHFLASIALFYQNKYSWYLVYFTTFFCFLAMFSFEPVAKVELHEPLFSFLKGFRFLSDSYFLLDEKF